MPLWHLRPCWRGPPSVPSTSREPTKTMVNRQKKTEGAGKVAATEAPKRRTTPKAAAPPRTAVVEVTAKTAKPRKKAASAPVPAPILRQEDIALRAYFISEKRQQQGLPGDSLSDWVEAEVQLLAEYLRSVLN